MFLLIVNFSLKMAVRNPHSTEFFRVKLHIMNAVQHLPVSIDIDVPRSCPLSQPATVEVAIQWNFFEGPVEWAANDVYLIN